MNSFRVNARTVWSDLRASLRLAFRKERWFALDVLGGTAGYAIWVAGTAALGLQVATLAEYQVAPGGKPTGPVLAILALLWLVLPALAGAAHLRARILNIRGNVERQYRVDRPGMLLAAPFAVVGVFAAGALVASGPAVPILVAALFPATMFLLVRTAAYSYRVYSFSHPVLVHATVFATLFVQAGVGLTYLGIANGQRSLVVEAADAVGLQGTIFSEADLVVTTVPFPIALAILVPTVLAGAFVVLQRVGVAVARRRDTDVTPSSVRTGQRYPPWWDVDRAGMTPSRRGTRGATDGAGASAENGGVTTDQATPDAKPAGESARPAAADDAGDTVTEPPSESSVEGASHTRVYTPPDSDLEDAPAPPAQRGDDGEDDVQEEDDPETVTVDENEDGDVADAPTAVVDERTCWSCDATLPDDDEVNYCPQCGEKIL